MGEMVERVARVLSKARGCEHEFPCTFCHWSPDEMTKDWDETGCMWMARGAIEAMRDPDLPMVGAGNDRMERSTGETGLTVWWAMIDKALD